MTQKEIKSRTNKKNTEIRPIHQKNPVLSLDFAPDFKATITTSGGSWNSVTFNSNFRPSKHLADWPCEKSCRQTSGCQNSLLIYLSVLFLSSPHFFGGLHVKAKTAFHLFFKGCLSFAGSSSDYYCAAQFIERNAANFLLVLEGGDMVCFSCF